jgi:hypothetical protein
MLRHQFSQHFILRLDLLFQIRDSFLLGLIVGAASLLEGGGSVLEELLLPAVERGWLKLDSSHRSEIGTPSNKCLLRMATFSSGV